MEVLKSPRGTDFRGDSAVPWHQHSHGERLGGHAEVVRAAATWSFLEAAPAAQVSTNATKRPGGDRRGEGVGGASGAQMCARSRLRGARVHM